MSRSRVTLASSEAAAMDRQVASPLTMRAGVAPTAVNLLFQAASS
ncbi:MAG TPA: hypothetical protein VK988_22845 [Acidimicrobiales bacterium]|nr:hypothetical protein [Acidimicrobiales bacterium]